MRPAVRNSALCSPKPMQNPLPIWIGGSKPRVMRAAAKYGHAFNITVSASAPGDLPDRLRDLDEACRAEKRDPKTLLRSAFLIACVGKTHAEAESRLDQLAARAKTDRAGFLKQRPGLVFGTADDAAEKLKSYADKGIKVSCLCPQGVRTRMLLGEDGTDENFLVAGSVSPEEVAGAVAYALSRPNDVALENITLSSLTGNL